MKLRSAVSTAMVFIAASAGLYLYLRQEIEVGKYGGNISNL